MTEAIAGLFFTHEIILALLGAALAIFAAVAIQSRKIGTFQFQISVFIMIWIAGEMADILQDIGLVSIFSNEVGMQLHLLSMVFFSAMIWIRFMYARQKQKRIVDKPPEDYFQ